jgi:hypothetical protein
MIGRDLTVVGTARDVWLQMHTDGYGTHALNESISDYSIAKPVAKLGRWHCMITVIDATLPQLLRSTLSRSACYLWESQKLRTSAIGTE